MAEKEYIERGALMLQIAGMKIHLKCDSDWMIGYRDALQAVGEVVQLFHAADVVEVRHGEWREHPEDWRKQMVGDECSLCGFAIFGGVSSFRYCPNCGAKMDGKGEGE